MYKFLIRPLLFRLPVDSAHEAAINLAETSSRNKVLLKAAGALFNYSDPSLTQKIWGLTFPNPVGLAAGFDKNGTLSPLMERLGFGFIEIGSITANPSTGNPEPRSFRLPEDQSLINRMGLNNDGAKTITRRLEKVSRKVPLGINIAKTHNPDISGDKALRDYKTSFDLAKTVADYITINISCPNTGDGKTFEDPGILNTLLDFLTLGKDSSFPPVLVKFSVDLSKQHLNELISVCEKFAISGYVATNTSANRNGLKTPPEVISSIGKGGLSGAAIKNKSTDIIRQIYEQTKGEKTIIGVGGIQHGEDAIEKLQAGADLLQVYTGMVYQGPSIVRQINKYISNYLKQQGIQHVYQIHHIKDQPGPP